jgi:cytochrome P450
LWISDPKGVQYILQTSRYSFVKPYAARFALNSATGPGVNGAEGDQIPRLSFDGHKTNGASIGPDHYRQRRILLPAFGAAETKAQIPVFRQCAREVNRASLAEP